MSDQPTKAEVEDLRAVIIPFGASGLYSDRFACIVRLCDAYLAQGEDLAAECIRYGKLAQLYRQQGEDMVEVLKQRDELKAENLALKSSTYRADEQDGE